MSVDLKQIPKLPQRQDATTDQLQDLRLVANRLGMYDAADYLRTVLDGVRSNNVVERDDESD
jgi:hypothetical protein